MEWPHWNQVITALVLIVNFGPLILLDGAQSPPPTAKPGEQTFFVGAIFDARDVILRRSLGRMVDEHNRDYMMRGFFLRVVVATSLTNDSARLQIDMCALLQSHRVIAFVVPGSQFVAADLYEFSRTLQVPIFAQNVRPPTDNSWALPPPKAESYSAAWSGSVPRGGRIRNGSYLFTLLPDTHRPLADILIHYGLVNFSYVCNSEAGMMRMESVIQRIHGQETYIDLNIDVRFLKNTAFAIDDLRHLDKFLSRYKKKNIILDLDTATDVEQVLRQLGQLGMLRDNYHYFLTVVKSTRFRVTDYIYSGVNLTSFNLVHSQTPRSWLTDDRNPDISADEAVTGDVALNVALMKDAISSLTRAVKQILADSSLASRLKGKTNLPIPTCYMRPRARYQVPEARIFAWKNGKQLISGDWWLGTMLANVLGRIRFHGRTHQVAFDESGRRDNYTLQVIEMKHREGMKPVGSWNTHEGLTMAGEPVRRDHRLQPSKNRTFIVVTIISPPFVTEKKPKAGEVLTGNNRFEGFCIELVHEIAKLVKFDYEIKLVEDGVYGAVVGEYPNKTTIWNGMIGELLNGTADVAVAPLTISSARARVVKFSEPFLTFGISLMIRRPGKKKPGIFSFLRPLANSVWWCISTACFVVACGLYIIARISPYEWTVLEDKVERDFTFMNSIWFSFSAFVQQGVDVAPRSPGARILSSVWWFFTLIMIAYYTANLAAFLTVSRIVKPINDWNDLLRPSIGIEYGTLDSGSTKNFFMETGLDPFKQMGQYMMKNRHVFVNKTEAGVKRVRQRKGKYAFIMESRMNEYYNNRHPCNTMMAATPFGDKGYGVATPIDSPLTEAINDAVLTLREEQKLAESYKRWWIEKGECHNDNEQSKSKALALINVAGAFYILVAGLGLALFTALLEFYCVVRREYKRSMASFPEMVRRKARMSMAGGEMDPPGRQEYECGRYGLSPVARTINLI